MRLKVTELGPADHVETGETAPNFTRPLVNEEFWEDVSLEDLLVDGPVLLLFHPMDGAFPTTYIYNELLDREISQYPAQVVGLSISTPYEHKTLIAERGIEHYRGVFSDPGNDVAEAYGIEHTLDGMAGIETPRPSLFLIDEDRTIQFAWVAEAWPEFPDYDALEDALETL